jgi:peptidoglycan hydrolase-like protein with peptidoglycan-binding domain
MNTFVASIWLNDFFLTLALNRSPSLAANRGFPSASIMIFQRALGVLRTNPLAALARPGTTPGPRFPVVSVSGVYDAATSSAVIALQNAYSLSPDGVAGPDTLGAMDDELSTLQLLTVGSAAAASGS